MREYTRATKVGTTRAPADPTDAGAAPASMTIVFDAGQNSAGNFAHLTAAGPRFVGPVPPSDCPDLLALPASRRTPVNDERSPGLTAVDTRRVVYGTDRRVLLTHSQSLQDDQARRFTDTTLAKVGRQRDELAATLARGCTRRTREQLARTQTLPVPNRAQDRCRRVWTAFNGELPLN